MYDHSFQGDPAWFRFTLKFTDPKTGETRTRAGMQVYRIEAGKRGDLVLAAKLGTAWPDAAGQEHLDEQATLRTAGYTSVGYRSGYTDHVAPA